MEYLPRFQLQQFDAIAPSEFCITFTTMPQHDSLYLGSAVIEQGMSHCLRVQTFEDDPRSSIKELASLHYLASFFLT